VWDALELMLGGGLELLLKGHVGGEPLVVTQQALHVLVLSR